jgi:hypothetical protein
VQIFVLGHTYTYNAYPLGVRYTHGYVIWVLAVFISRNVIYLASNGSKECPSVYASVPRETIPLKRLYYIVIVIVIMWALYDWAAM